MSRILAALTSVISAFVLAFGLIGTTSPRVMAADPCGSAQLMNSNANNPATNPDVHGIYSDQATIFAGQNVNGQIGTLKITLNYCKANHGGFAQFVFHSYDTTDYQQIYGACRIVLVQSLSDSPLPHNSASCPSGTLVNDVAVDTPLLPEPSRDSSGDTWNARFEIQNPPGGSYVSNAHVTCDKRDVFPFTGNTACATPVMQNP